MTNLLVTGGAGFIGANFVYHWLRHHPADRVVVVDSLTYAGNPANLDSVRSNHLPFVHLEHLRIDRMTALMREESIDCVISPPSRTWTVRSAAR